MFELGSRIKETRLRRHLTQKNLAKRINKCPSAISAYESGALVPPVDVLRSIAVTLNVTMDYLVGLDDKYSFFGKSISTDQMHIIDLLLSEFSMPSNVGDSLSPRQLEILQKLILLFSNKTGDK